MVPRPGGERGNFVCRSAPRSPEGFARCGLRQLPSSRERQTRHFSSERRAEYPDAGARGEASTAADSSALHLRADQELDGRRRVRRTEATECRYRRGSTLRHTARVLRHRLCNQGTDGRHIPRPVPSVRRRHGREIHSGRGHPRARREPVSKLRRISARRRGAHRARCRPRASRAANAAQGRRPPRFELVVADRGECHDPLPPSSPRPQARSRPSAHSR